MAATYYIGRGDKRHFAWSSDPNVEPIHNWLAFRCGKRARLSDCTESPCQPTCEGCKREDDERHFEVA